MKILIVEDDRDYRAVLYEFLHREGHDVLAVSDALHAVALLDEKDNAIDLVIMDLNMPRMGGDKIMETFANWSKCRTHFVIMSGILDPDKYKNYPKVIGCLHKPITSEAMSAMLSKASTVVAQHKAEQASKC